LNLLGIFCQWPTVSAGPAQLKGLSTPRDVPAVMAGSSHVKPGHDGGE